MNADGRANHFLADIGMDQSRADHCGFRLDGGDDEVLQLQLRFCDFGDDAADFRLTRARERLDRDQSGVLNCIDEILEIESCSDCRSVAVENRLDVIRAPDIVENEDDHAAVVEMLGNVFNRARKSTDGHCCKRRRLKQNCIGFALDIEIVGDFVFRLRIDEQKFLFGAELEIEIGIGVDKFDDVFGIGRDEASKCSTVL